MDSRIFNLFKEANAAYYVDKHEWFYPLKEKILRQEGQYDGFTTQVLDKGSRFLQVYILNGEKFHIPGRPTVEQYDTLKGTIHGHIKHDIVKGETGCVAMLILLKYYDLARFNKLIERDEHWAVDIYHMNKDHINNTVLNLKMKKAG